MTVVHLSVGNCFGGVEAHICTLVKLLKDIDISFKIVCQKTVLHEFEKRLKGFDIELIGVDLQSVLSPNAFLSLVKIFKDMSPDLVHCHLYSATRVGAMAAKIAGVNKVVETIHIEEVWRRGINKLIFCSLDAVNGWLFVDKYIAVSNAVAQYYQKNKAVPEKKITLIHNTTVHEDAEILPTEFSFRIGFLGRLSEQKGIDILIQAVDMIHRQDIDCTLLIAGEGPLKSKLEELVRDCDLEEKVQFLGFVSDKNKFFNMIDIFALTSRNEGFPLVLLEAGMYQKPVVATRVSGNPEIIKDEVTGLLVENENPKEVASALLELRTPEKREQLSKNLRNFVESDFSPVIYAKKMRKFYTSIVEK